MVSNAEFASNSQYDVESSFNAISYAERLLLFSNSETIFLKYIHSFFRKQMRSKNNLVTDKY